MTKPIRYCSIDGCGRRCEGRGYCLRHYKRWRRHGNPVAGQASRVEIRTFFESLLSNESDVCVLWPYARGTFGYGEVSEGSVHRLICEKIYGPPPTPFHQAAHSCGRGKDGCVAKRHIRWATRSENELDKILHGTHHRGERHPLAKLTDDQVSYIKQQLRLGNIPQKDLAIQFEVSKGAISHIARGSTWSWL
jgi:hypothetical protein